MAAQIPGALFTEVMKWIKKETEETDEHGDPFHADMASWLSAKVAIGDYPNQLDALEKQVLACLVKNSKMVKAETLLSVCPRVPPADDGSDPAGRAEACKHRVSLKHMGVHEKLSLKGASNAFAILQALQTSMCGKGNQTEKYPIELLFNLGGLTDGTPLAPLTVGMGIGNGVVLSSHLMAAAAIRFQWFGSAAGSDAVRLLHDHNAVHVDLARRMLRVLRLTGTYDPKPDLKKQVTETLTSKMQAAARTRPTTLQMLFGPVTQASCSARFCQCALTMCGLELYHDVTILTFVTSL